MASEHTGGWRKRRDPNETWCRKNVTPEEHAAFWKHWCETQWGLPTFAIERLCVEKMRERAAIALTAGETG